MRIGIFCSANNLIDSTFFLLTEELGRWAARNGHIIVFGGVNQGLMECVAKAVKESGGETVGVVPSIVEETGRTSQYNDRVLTCNNLNERKQLMLDESDVFIALPGGVGTLDEVFTVAASYTIGYHHKRVILYNMKGFWDSTISMLDDLQQRGMVRGQWRDYICVADNLDEIGKILAKC
ncbi:MAG: TIGR00730 family Rossman fold protein [Prevotella sp.]|nr:TIGR00730 family Rossman fold protein [Prevotella sp.]